MKESPCLTRTCRNTRRHGHFCCIHCWHSLPEWLRIRCIEERRNCRIAGIQHSQRLFALRDRALTILNHTDRQPTAPQPDERTAHAV